MKGRCVWMFRDNKIHDLLNEYIRRAEYMDAYKELEDMKFIKGYISRLENKLAKFSIEEYEKGERDG